MTWLPGGHNDWFSINLTGPSFKLRFNHPASYHEKNFDVVASTAAQLLASDWNDKPLYLAMSGGIDSELVARILYQNQIPFTPVILKIDKINELESWYAEYWCYQRNLTPVILNYTVEEYTDSLTKCFPTLHTLKNYYQTPILLIYDYVYRAGGYCLYAAGDINLNDKLFYCESLDFISNIVDIGNHPTSFFMYTPELAWSYVNQFDNSTSEQYNKLKFYNVAPRPKINYINPLHEIPLVKDILHKLFYIFKLDKSSYEPAHWYGTKDQLLQSLCK